MKTLFVILMLLVSLPVYAAGPYLVCDPQTDATGYIYTLNNGDEVTVPYQEKALSGITYAVIADLEFLPNGPFTFAVKAYRDDPEWGRLQSAAVPFSGVRPSIGGPLHPAIKR